MPKKHQYRASAAEKKKRADALRKEKNAAFWEKNKKPIIIGAAALIILIVAAVLIVNAITARGSLKVVDGQVEGLQENWLVDNLGTEKRPLYFKIAEVNIPEGYKNLGKLTNDPVEQNFLLASEREDAMMDQVLIMNMPKKSAKELADTLDATSQGLLYVLEAEDTVHTEIAGKDVYYRALTCADISYDSEGNPVSIKGIYKVIGSYINRDSKGCLMVYMTTKTFAPEQPMGSASDEIIAPEDLLPTEEELLAAMAEFIGGIVIE